MNKVRAEVPAARLWRYAWYRGIVILYRALLFSPLQVMLLRLCGARIGRNVVLEPSSFYNLYVAGFANLVIGDEVYVGPECLFDLANPLALGDQVTLAARVNIATHCNVGYADHPLQAHMPRVDAGVSVGAGSFIGTGSTILPGANIGPVAIVAAGSVVTEPLAGHAVYAGVPARKLRDLAGTSASPVL